MCGFVLLHFIPHSIPCLSAILRLGWELLNSHQHTTAWSVTATFHSTLQSSPLTPRAPLLGYHSSISFGTPLSELPCLHLKLHSSSPPSGYNSVSIGTPEFPLSLLCCDCVLFSFIPHSSGTFCVLLSSTQHSSSGTPLFLVVVLLFLPHIAFHTPI
jgi:hypothetical protein